VVVPPFQVRVVAWGLGAGAAADPAEEHGDVGTFERLGFAVLPDESDGPGWFGQVALGAHPPGLAVVGRKGQARLMATAIVDASPSSTRPASST
jgi:hypothetical protein